MFVNIRLYEKGLRLLPVDLQAQLVKYLLKSHGNDVCNDIFFYVAAECNLNFPDANLKPEQRTKIAQECGQSFAWTTDFHLSRYVFLKCIVSIISGQEYKSALVALNKAVAGSSVDEFLEATENALEACGMILKKVDKKKDR